MSRPQTKERERERLQTKYTSEREQRAESIEQLNNIIGYIENEIANVRGL